MEIIYYKEKDGSSPVERFFKKLPKSIEARFYDYFHHLLEHEGKLTQGKAFKKLFGYPLEEVRVKHSNNLHRVIIHVRIKDSIYVLHAFTKKEGEETPSKELKIAHERFLELKPSLK